MDVTTQIANVEVNVAGFDVDFTEAGVRDGVTYVQGYVHDSGDNFVMSVADDAGLAEAGGNHANRKGAIDNFKAGLNADKLGTMYTDPNTFRTLISPNDAASGLDDGVVDKVNADYFRNTVAADDVPITPNKLRSLRDEFMDVAKLLTKRVPAPVALAIGGVLMSNGVMAADELALAVVPGGNALEQSLEGNFAEAVMLLVGDFDPSMFGSEVLRAFLHSQGANVEPPLINALRDVSGQYLKQIESEQELIFANAINEGVLPDKFRNTETGMVQSTLEVLRDDVRAEALLLHFSFHGNEQAVAAIEMVQDQEDTREMVKAVYGLVENLSVDVIADRSLDVNGGAIQLKV